MLLLSAIDFQGTSKLIGKASQHVSNDSTCKPFSLIWMCFAGVLFVFAFGGDQKATTRAKMLLTSNFKTLPNINNILPYFLLFPLTYPMIKHFIVLAQKKIRAAV